MLDRVKGHRWLMLPAVLVFPGVVMALGAGPLGGDNFALLAAVAAPLLFAAATLLLHVLEEKSLIDYVPLGCALIIYLVLLGDLTRACPCGVDLPAGRVDGFAVVAFPYYDMKACFTFAGPLAAMAFGCMLLPDYNRKTLCYRFAAFAAAFMPFAALSFLDMLTRVHGD